MTDTPEWVPQAIGVHGGLLSMLDYACKIESRVWAWKPRQLISQINER